MNSDPPEREQFMVNY